MKKIIISPEVLAVMIELLKWNPLEEIKTINCYTVIIEDGDTELD